MEPDNMPEDELRRDAIFGRSNTMEDISPQPSNKTSMPMIAAILLIISGVTAILFWISIITIDMSTIESLIDISQLQQINPSITPGQIKEMLTLCGAIGVIIAVFPILGGVLSFKRKLWRIALVGGILGLLTMGPFFASSILALVGIVLIAVSRKEFQ